MLLLFFTSLIISTLSQCPININVPNVMAHLNQLDRIAQANNNNRAAGTSGYADSTGYIVSQLASTSLSVSVQSFTFTNFEIIGTPTLSQSSPVVKNYNYPNDFRLLTGSGSGDIIQGFVYNVPNYGCNASDWALFPPGVIAVLSRGVCSFTEKAAFAQALDAAAVIIYNTDGGGTFNGNIDTTLPAISVSNIVGLDLTNTVKLSYSIQTLKVETLTNNVIAESVTGDPNSIIIVGSHLDSVPAGPGINDNGSGSAVNLEIAKTLTSCLSNQKHKMRFAWWGAEERGLLGSRYYVEDLKTKNELSRVTLNLNFDMVGSPNWFYGVYNGTGAAQPIRDRSVLIQRLFEGYLINQGKPYDLTPFDGRSDYGPFIENGVPAGGLFSGAEAIKDATGRRKYKGLANTAYDPCYHAYCDSYENISEESMTTLANAAYVVTHNLVTSLEISPSLYKPGQPIHMLEDPHPEAFSHY